MPLQIRRGNTDEINNVTPLIGEMIYDTQLKRVVVGDGSTPGGTPISGVTLNEAKDAAADSLLAGIHQNISFTYNSTTKALSAKVDILTHDTIVADAVDTAAIKDGSTVVLDVANSQLNGSVKGSVLADDSSTIIDSATKELFIDTINMGSAQITEAAGIIDIPASSTIGGQPFAVRISTDDSTVESFGMNDIIEVIGESGVETLVDNGLIKIRSNGSLPITPQESEPEEHYVAFADGFNGVRTIKAGGTLKFTPSTGILFAPGVSTLSLTSTNSIATTDITAGTLTSNSLLVLASNLTTGVQRRLVQVGSGLIDGRFGVVTNSYSGSNAFVAFSQAHETVDVANFQFARYRGTTDSPSTVVTGDDIADITFSAHNGTATLNAANITVKTEGTIVPGVAGVGRVPGRIEISTTTVSGNLVDALVIDSNTVSTFSGAVKFPVYANPTARDTAITSGIVAAGMVVFLTDSTGSGGAPRLQVNTDSTTSGWVDLH